MKSLQLNNPMQLVAYNTPKSLLPPYFTGKFEVCCVRLSECAAARQVHASMQALAVWMIDAASAINSDDTKWHLILLQAQVQHPDVPAHYWVPVGYVTLFQFFTPTRRARPMSMRLAQALVLPPLHRQGHGAMLLRCAHRLAESLDAFQLTVEDPADGFRRLRDAHDIELAESRKIFPPVCASMVRTSSCIKSYVKVFDAAWIAVAVRGLQITEQQCQRVAEAHTLRMLSQAALSAGVDSASKAESSSELLAAFKEWRLAVKRRTYSNEADLRSVPADVRKAHLHAAFEWDLGSYKSALQRLFGPAHAVAIRHLVEACQ